MSSTELIQNESTQEEVILGRIKWFNNKSGYGFITITDGPRSGSDIFAHHSGIIVSNDQYRYLVQGEYVEFKLEKSSGNHEYQAVDIRGIKGGKLMCETRRELQEVRNSYKKNDNVDRDVKESSEPRAPRETRETREPREPRETREPREPRETRETREPREPKVRHDSKEWKLVKSSRSQTTNPKSRARPTK
jgi:cold shock CspA family protein